MAARSPAAWRSKPCPKCNAQPGQNCIGTSNGRPHRPRFQGGIKSTGRPTDFTPELFAKICEQLSTGKTLVQICAQPGFPTDWTVRNWARNSPQLFSDLARARKTGFDAIALETLRISDDSSSDFRTVTREDGRKVRVFDAEHVQRSKLRVETRLKLLACWDPSRYGMGLTLRGDKEKPIAIKAVDLSEAELLRIARGEPAVLEHEPDE